MKPFYRVLSLITAELKNDQINQNLKHHKSVKIDSLAFGVGGFCFFVSLLNCVQLSDVSAE